MRGVEVGLKEERVVAFVGVNGDVHGFDAGFFEMFLELGLFFGVEAEVRVDGEEEPALLVGAAAVKELGGGLGASFFGAVEGGPEVDDAEVGVGVEACDEFFPLVEHVALDLIADLEPREGAVGGDDVFAGAAFDGVEMDEGFVGDHASEGESVEGRLAVVVVAA